MAGFPAAPAAPASPGASAAPPAGAHTFRNLLLVFLALAGGVAFFLRVFSSSKQDNGAVFESTRPDFNLGDLSDSALAYLRSTGKFPAADGAQPSSSASSPATAVGASATCQTTPGGRPRALVTGISGMIGSYVAKEILKSGKYDVVGLVRYRSDLSNLAGVLDKLELVYGDITDEGRMREVVKRTCPHFVFHFAAQAINGVSYDSAGLTLDANIKGTFNMLEAVRAAGLTKTTRFLLAGSSTEYGHTADTWDGPIPEKAPMEPISPYGVSKAAAELLARQYFQSYGMQVVISRFFIQVAAGGTESLAVHEFSRQIAMIERGLQPPVLMHGTITTKRDVTDMHDSAKVVVQLAERGEVGEAYNVGSGIAVSTKDILETAVSFSTRKDIKLEMDPTRVRVYDEKVLLSDNSKVRALTGWVPSPDIKKTVSDILVYWRRKVNVRYPVEDGKLAGARKFSSITERVETPQPACATVGSRHGVAAAEGGRPRALVTGISGMIGSYVAKEIIRSGKYDVVGLVRYRSDLSNLAGFLGQIELVYGDITDEGRMREVVKRTCPHFVFHFAAQAINGVSYDSAGLTLDANIKGTFNMLEAVRAAGLTKTTRFLLAGSSTEYGHTADTWDGPIPEKAPMEPISPYGVSKAAAELLARQYFQSYGMQVVISRFFIQVAAGGTESLAVHEFSRQIAMIERGLQPPVLMHGTITTKRDVTDMHDSAKVVVQLAERGEVGEAYNVGSGIAVSTKDILETAVSFSTRKDIKLEMDPTRVRVYDEKVLLSDNSKVRALTGWVPSPDIKKTVSDILVYWRRKVNERFPVTDAAGAAAVAAQRATPVVTTTTTLPPATTTSTTTAAAAGSPSTNPTESAASWWSPPTIFDGKLDKPLGRLPAEEAKIKALLKTHLDKGEPVYVVDNVRVPVTERTNLRPHPSGFTSSIVMQTFYKRFDMVEVLCEEMLLGPVWPDELIVMIGSADKVGEDKKHGLWERLSAKFPRVVFLENPDQAGNRQPSFGFNSIMLAAKGDVLIITHDDDPLHPQVRAW